MSSAATATVNRAPGVVWGRRGDDGETVILVSRTGSYHTLNVMGAQMWALLEPGMTIERIIAAISNEYDASAEEIERDVKRFVRELEDLGAVMIGTPAR